MPFFSLDGIDGVGKSTQARLFRAWLEARGWSVVDCRDPGTTVLGESLRQLVLDPHGAPVAPRAEMLIYMAARAQLVAEVIRPALEAGKVVVSDRFVLANIAYQAYAGGLDPDEVRAVGRIATDGIQPDRVFLLDLPVDQAVARRARDPDRMEARGAEYLERVRRGFLLEAQRDPEHICVVDASGSVDEIQLCIRRHAEDVLRTCTHVSHSVEGKPGS